MQLPEIMQISKILLKTQRPHRCTLFERWSVKQLKFEIVFFNYTVVNRVYMTVSFSIRKDLLH